MIPGIVVCNKYYDEPIGMQDAYQSFLRDGIPEDIREKAVAHVAGLRQKIQQPSYMELTKKPFKLLTKYKVATFFKRITKEKIPVNSISARRHPLLNPIRWSFFKRVNIWRTRWSHNKWFAKNVEPDARYFLYPLHYEPESSTSVRAFYFSDQLALIKLISKLLPPGVKLIVKEHGGNQGYRKPGFYRELYYMPNVTLLPPSANVSSLVKNCIGVITLTGRMGWEAIANNKHVITLGRTFWTTFDSVHYVESWRELSEAMNECCKDSGSGNNYDSNLISFASSYIQCIHDGSFVLNSSSFMTDDNVGKFCDLLLGLLPK